MLADYFGSEKSANSEIAGHTGACVMRSRTFAVVTGWLRSSRQLPMLVPEAISIQLPSAKYLSQRPRPADRAVDTRAAVRR